MEVEMQELGVGGRGCVAWLQECHDILEVAEALSV